MISFLIFFLIAVWQDILHRSISRCLIIAAGGAGALWCLYCGRNIGNIMVSSGIGIVLLLSGKITGGGIGEGDGWFFIVSGLFLKPEENIILLLSGIMFCGIFSLVLVFMAFAEGKNVRGKRLPFLPFLVPCGLWLGLSKAVENGMLQVLP